MQFKKIVLVAAAAAVALPATGGAVHAADVLMDRRPMAQVEPPPPPRAPWAGPYVGSHLGWTFQNVDTSSGGASASYDADGSAGGILAGWMFQSGMITYGIEADITIQETKGEVPGAFGGTGVSSDFAWNSSLRARLGVDLGRFMPYLTAGVAIADMHQKMVPAPLGGDVQTLTGWTAGGGIDVKVWEPYVVRLEYIYADYGDEGFAYGGATFSTETDTHTIRGALITQLGGNSEIKTPRWSGPGRWAGHYGGIVGGWVGSWADGSGPGPGGPSFSYTLSGVAIGIVGGTNWQWGSIVAGFESDLNYLLDVEGSSGTGGLTSEIMWQSHTRVRLGYDAGRVMPFIAGGFSVTQHEHNRIGFTQADLSPKWGWTLGAGLDIAIDDRLAARVEYLHDDMRDVDVVFADGTRTIDMPSETVRVGLIYRAGP